MQLHALPMLVAKCSAQYSRGGLRCLVLAKNQLNCLQGVTASVSGQTVEVKGPKGTRSYSATDDVTIVLSKIAPYQ